MLNLKIKFHSEKINKLTNLKENFCFDLKAHNDRVL
jgi:hypothetical protein